MGSVSIFPKPKGGNPLLASMLAVFHAMTKEVSSKLHPSPNRSMNFAEKMRSFL